jgi:ribosomal protein L2
MDLIQARSIRTRLRGYPGRALEKAQDHQAAVRVRDRVVPDLEAAQARVVAEVVVDPDREAVQARVVEEAEAVPDLAVAQARVVADAVVDPGQEAMVATENNLNLMKNL